MEAKLTKAARVARKLSAGPRPKKSESLGPLGAIARVIQEMERVENALAEENMTMDDAQVNLLYALPGNSDNPLGYVGNVRCGRVPTEFFEKVVAMKDAQFLGVLTLIADRDTGKFLPYVKAFLVDPDSVQTILQFLEAARRGKHWAN